MKASGRELVNQIERETPEPGPDCITRDQDQITHEVPEVEQKWLPGPVPPLPAMIWCFTHRTWERKPKEENNG